MTTADDAQVEPDATPTVPEVIEVRAEAPYQTAGRVDPIYEPTVRQYHAPVAETRSFWSRFWWFIPMLLLLIALPFLLHSCNRAETCTTLPASVWNSSLQNSTWASVASLDSTIFTDTHREDVLSELAFLCNQRLAGHSLELADVAARFDQLALTESVTRDLLNLVNSGQFCRCR